MSLSADLSCLQSGAGAEREAAMASLEKQLICPICMEIFNKPVVILPCQHNLCRKCANELYQPSLFQARTSMLVSSGRFRCPTCRHEVILDRHGVYGLQRNLLVENIIDVYKQEVCKSLAISPPPPPPLPPPEPPQATCTDHEGEKVNIYCLSCRVPTCSLCKVFGAHQSCKVAPLTQVYQQQQDELREGLDSLAEHRTQIQTVIDELNQMCIDLEAAYRAQRQTVTEKFEQINSVLEERRKSMTEVITAEEEEKTGRAKALLRRYGDTVSANSKLLERAQANMEDTDSVAFVQSSKEIIDKLLGATASCPSETLDPDDEDLSHYQYNFSRQYRALISLDFPREDVPEEFETESETEDTEDIIEDTEDAHAQYTESPSHTFKDCPLIVPPEPQERMDTERGDRGDRGDTRDGTELRHRGAMAVQTQRQDSPGETQRRPKTPEGVKEEGMTTLQEKAAGSEDGEMLQQGAPQVEQGNKKQTNSALDEETDTLLYPGWYRQSEWGRLSPIYKENQNSSTDLNAVHANIISKAKEEDDVASNAPETTYEPSESQDVKMDEQNMSLQSPNQSEIKQIQPQLELNHESENLQDLESLPQALNENLEEIFEDGNAHKQIDNVPAEESASQNENTEMKNDNVEMPRENLQSSSDESLSSDHDAEETEGDNDQFEEENLTEEIAGDVEDIVGIQQEAIESSGQSLEEGIRGNLAVQAVTLLFYLLAFLVILQRFWVYIGRYILI